MKSKKTLIPYLLWMALFVVIPLVMVITSAFTDDAGSFTVANLQKVITDETVRAAVPHSLWIALLSTILCLLLSYPLALIMSRMKPAAQRMMNILIMLPMWMNFVLRICSLMLIFHPDGVFDSVMHAFGIEGQNPIFHTDAAVVIGIVYDYLPFMVLPIYTTMAKIPRSLIEAGQDLGCNSWRILWKVIFPLSIPGVVSGITMVFVPAASAFVISTKLGGFPLVGDIIDLYYMGTGADKHLGSALAVLFMVIIVISIIILNRVDDDDGIVLA